MILIEPPMKIEKLGDKLLQKQMVNKEQLDRLIDRKTQAKTPLSFARAQLQIIRKLQLGFNYSELIAIWEDLIVRIESYEKIKAEVHLKNWKGKDKLSFIEHPETFEIIQHRKNDQDTEANEIRTEISKDEINRVIWAIGQSRMIENTQTKELCIETPEIARNFCIISKLVNNKKGNPLFHQSGNFEWQFFFGDRHLHTNLNLILRLLDHYNIIRYRGGLTYLLKKEFKFQTILR